MRVKSSGSGRLRRRRPGGSRDGSSGADAPCVTCGGATGPPLLRQLYFDGPLSRQELGPRHRPELRLRQQRGRRTRSTTGCVEEAGVGRLRRRPAAHPAAGRPGYALPDRRRRRRDPGPGRAVRPRHDRAGPRRTPVDPRRPRRRPWSSATSLAGIADGAARGRRRPGERARRRRRRARHRRRSAPGGAVVHGQTIGWDAVPLEALLRGAGDSDACRCYIDNGAKTLGQAEMWFGAGRGARHAVIALIGSGRRRRRRHRRRHRTGARTSSAGEWGHTDAAVSAAGAAAAARAAAWRRTSAPRRCWTATGEAGGGRGAAASTRRPRSTALLAAAADDGRATGATRCSTRPPSTSAPGIADLINLFNPERIVHRRLGRAAARRPPAAGDPRGRGRARAAPPVRADLDRAGPARRRRGRAGRGHPAAGAAAGGRRRAH